MDLRLANITMTAAETHADTTDVDCANACVSLTHLQASRFPLMRRFDQQYVVEDKLTTYQHEISRLSSINRNALSSLDDQERRLRDMQARLRGTSSTPTSSAARSCLATRSENDVPKHCCGGPQHEEKYVLTSFDAGDVLHPITSQMVAISTDQTQILPDDITPMDADDCFPTAPTNLRASEVTHDSLSLQWDVVHDRSIVDFEIRYCYMAEGSEKEVRLSCARWCLKDPVPTNGRFVVKSLQPNTTYRNISIRSRNHVGWGTFSDPVPCLTTASKDDDFDCRRSKFLYRIGYIVDSIDELETELDQIPAKQMALANNMANSERRMMALNEEIERVAMHGENEQLSSHLLHGATQTFSQAVLKRTLEYELSVCKKHMAEWRALIIGLDVERREIAAEIEHATDRLNERKAALARFDKQRAAVSGMRRAIFSKPPDQLKRYYISRWKSRVAYRLDTRDKLDSLAKSCRRRIYSKVWRKLSLLVKSREELLQGERHNEADGIGGMLLSQAESSVEETVADACLLIHQLGHLNVEANPADSKTVTRNSSSYPANLLSKEDGTTLLKGDFLYKSGHYDQALKSYERVLSKMEDRVYFSGLKSADAAALYAEVNGKMGHAQVKLNSFDLGLVYFGRQLALAEEEDLDAPRAEALLGLGICSHHKADYFYSESLLKQALEIFSSMGNQQEAKQLACYEWLKKCYECLNLNDRKELFANKCKELDHCANDRLNREHAVKESIGRLDSMRNRLVNVIATNSQVIKMEIVSAHFVKLLRLKAKKEKELMESTEHLSATAQSAEDLRGLIDQIEAEIAGARQTKKGFLVSRLIQGHNQEVKAAELLIRLEEELKVVRVQHDESLVDISQTEMTIKNLNDDIIVLREELVVEQCPLMQRVLQCRTYRCASLNASNIAANDVTGKSKNGYPSIALSDGETCYIHNLETGKMEHAFVGDEDGGTAIITSLCFRGHQVYTGSMDSTLIAWDTNTSSKNWSATGHEAAVTCIYADDSKVISGSADQTIILWSASEGTLLWKQAGHSRGVHCISASHSSIVSTSFATILVWDIIADERGPSQKIKSLDCRCRFVSEGNVTALQYGELEIITGDDLGRISVWWVESSELLRTFPVHKGKVTALQVDATKVVSSGTDGLIHISDLFRGETLHTLRGHSNPVLSVSFDGNQIISLSSEGELRYWPWEK